MTTNRSAAADGRDSDELIWVPLTRAELEDIHLICDHDIAAHVADQALEPDDKQFRLRYVEKLRRILAAEQPACPAVLVVRDPDFENDYTHDPGVEILSVDVGSSYAGFNDLQDSLRDGDPDTLEWIAGHRRAAGRFAPGHPIRQRIRQLIADAAEPTGIDDDSQAGFEVRFKAEDAAGEQPIGPVIVLHRPTCQVAETFDARVTRPDAEQLAADDGTELTEGTAVGILEARFESYGDGTRGHLQITLADSGQRVESIADIARNDALHVARQYGLQALLVSR